MNIQNPSFPSHAYGYGNSVVQPEGMAHFQSDFSQGQFQQPALPTNIPQRIPQYPQQIQGQVPAHLYNQFQQQQLQQQQQYSGAFARPQSRGALPIAPSQPSRPVSGSQHQRQQSANIPGNASNTSSSQTPIAATTKMQQSPAAAQAGMGNNPNQAIRNNAQQAANPMSPQAIAREKERVSTLLEINSHLIQEVASLQAQGRAGSLGQQSPASPTSGADASNPGSNSPSDPSKRQPPSQEYADCMRRLQTNLAYLAAIADANKKATGTRPPAPAIMVPPPHLSSVHGLYQKLKILFPEASQTVLNKAMAVVNAQATKSNQVQVQAQAQGVS